MSNEGELERKPDGSADLPMTEVESIGGEGVSGGVVSEERVDEANEILSGGVDGSNGSVGESGLEEARVCSEEPDSGDLLAEARVLEDVELNRGNDGSVVASLSSERVMLEDVGNITDEIRVSEDKAEGEEVVWSDVFAVRESEFGQMETGPDGGARVSSGEIIEEPIRSDVFAARESELWQMETGPDEGTRVSSGKNIEEQIRSDVFAARESELWQMETGPDEGTRVSSGKNIEEPSFSEFGAVYAAVEEGTASRMLEVAFGSQAARAMSYGFEPGDMVWGKVKSHPWWPGHVFNEAFASPSVRRSKREGHVLVAFFGDSSYGWFDLAELIPFEPYYAEKSRQTNSRNFTKAVEEAVDEACRRQALGLTCRCRNKFNFRPTYVQGHFSVDVPGYEHGAVYSVQQIKKSRDDFHPTKVLSFVQQLATMPRSYDQRSIDWVHYKATVLAYRKASFEEFDETYAQAFGVQPIRPSPESLGYLDQLAKAPSRAPLSGPLVVAEALGERKISGRLTKVKEQTRKDKYLFKRRDEPVEPRAFQYTQVHTDFAVSSAYREGAMTTAPGDYVFQKRTPPVMSKPAYASQQEGPGIIGTGGAAFTGDVRGQENESVERKLVTTTFSSVGNQANMNPIDSPAGFGVSFPPNQPVAYDRTSVMQGGLEDGKLYPNMESSMHEMDAMTKSDVTLRVVATGHDRSIKMEKLESHGYVDNLKQNSVQDSRGVVDLKSKDTNLYSSFEVLEQYKQALSMPVENHSGPYQVLEGGHSITAVESVGAPLHIDAKLSGSVVGTNTDRVAKKKVLKRPADDLHPDKSNIREVKKRKRKKLGIKNTLENNQGNLKMVKDGELLGKSAGKSIGVGLVPRENSQLDQLGKENGVSSNFPSDSAVLQPNIDLGNIEIELPQLVSDLLGLALDPFHGIERNSSAIVRHILLRFRSLVYQKSLVLVPQGEAESSELGASKSSASTELAEIPHVEDVKPLPSKQRKHFKRPDDPTKAGRKRNLSDRQEEMSVKRLKKINELKAMTTEKRSGNQKMQELQREQKDAVEQKEMGTTAAGKPMKPVLVKKQDLPAKLLEPAMLVIKFPQRTTLPSIPELKARFGRFGPLDHSAMRVFWKSYTCRVVFKHKDHAQAAHNYAVQNKALFGHVKVSYYVRDLEVPAPEVIEPAKPDEVVQFRPGGGNDSVGETGAAAAARRPQQPTAQLKSCLKKPSAGGGGETGGMGPRESPRVKFMLGGEESGNRGEQSVTTGSSSSSRDINKNDGGGASSSLAMDVNSKNFQKLLPVLQPNVVPRAPRILDMHDTQFQTRGLGHFNKSPYAPPFNEVEPINNKNNNIDISHQMLSLLVRCNDIVMDVKCTLGYVPYHPL